MTSGRVGAWHNSSPGITRRLGLSQLLEALDDRLIASCESYAVIPNGGRRCLRSSSHDVFDARGDSTRQCDPSSGNKEMTRDFL